MTVYASPCTSGSSNIYFFETGDIVIFVAPGRGAVNVGIVNGVSPRGGGMVLVRFWREDSKSLSLSGSTIYPEHLVRIGRIE